MKKDNSAIGDNKKEVLKSKLRVSLQRNIKNKEVVATNGNGEKILIIEDEASIRRILEKMFERTNYKTVFAGTLAEAEGIYRRNYSSIDLILCDIILPDGNGIELIKRLKKINPIEKIIYVSGYIGNQSWWEEIKNNNIPFIHKPFSMNELFRVISKTLGS